MKNVNRLTFIAGTGILLLAAGCFDVEVKLDRSGGGTMALSYPAPKTARLAAQRSRFSSPAVRVTDIGIEEGLLKVAVAFDDVTRLSEAPAFSHLKVRRERTANGLEKITVDIINKRGKPTIKGGRPGSITLAVPGAIMDTNGKPLDNERVRWKIPLKDYFGKPRVTLLVTYSAGSSEGAPGGKDPLQAALSRPQAEGKPAGMYKELVARLADQTRSRPGSGKAQGTVPYASVPRVLLPSTEIEDERRYVTAAEREFELVPPRLREIRVPADGKLEVSYRLPPRLRSASAILLVVSVKRAEDQWEEVFREIVSPAPGGLVRASLPLESAAGAIVKLSVAVPLSKSAKWRSRPVAIPPNATLEFGFGIEEAGWREGAPPVVFRVFASEPGGQAPRTLFEARLDPATKREDRGWKDQRVSLEWAAGKTVSFLFETIIEGKQPAATYPVWSNPTVFATRPRPQQAHNIILISIDTLRAQELGCYDYRLPTSPFLEELSRDPGTVVFDKAFSTSATTPQAHMSMFTSLEPSLHGITTGMERLSDKLITVSEILWRHGYETGAVTEDGWLSGGHGFARGMNTYKENKSADLMAPMGQVDETVKEAVAWLERHGKKKFFLFVHTFQVHAPYAPPEEYTNLFLPFSRDGKRYADVSKMPSYLADQLNYDREIRYTDDQLRRLFRALSEMDLARRTVVFITSDHGEEFMEHGYLQHGAHLYEEAVRVPLIVWAPGIVEHGPRRVSRPVSILDLMPTILGLVGLPTFAELRGVSLAPTIATGAQPPADRKLVIEAWGAGVLSEGGPIDGWKPPAFAVRTERFKYIMTDLKKANGPKFELYDLEVDPGETKNLLADGRDPFPEGRAILSSYQAEASARRKLLVGPKAIGRRAPVQIPLGRDREEKLRALGYIE